MLAEAENVRSDPHFDTQKRAILSIWDQMQRLQTDFAIAQELSFFYSLPEWHTARTVLDLGSGNGYYLEKLAARFSDKIYNGIDSSVELVEIAESEAGGESVSFSHKNLFDVRECYDFVLARLLLQHLDDISSALDHIASITNPKGSAVIIDAHDPFRLFYPEIPEFTDFFAAYTAHERTAGRDRNVANRVEQAVASNSAWRMGSALQLLIPSTIQGNLELFTRTYSLLVDLVEQAGELTYNFSDVKRRWHRWAKRPDAYAQVGLNLIQIVRLPS